MEQRTRPTVTIDLEEYNELLKNQITGQVPLSLIPPEPLGVSGMTHIPGRYTVRVGEKNKGQADIANFILFNPADAADFTRRYTLKLFKNDKL